MISITEEDLTPYAIEKMENLQTTDLPQPFALPKDLGIEDDNELWDAFIQNYNKA